MLSDWNFTRCWKLKFLTTLVSRPLDHLTCPLRNLYAGQEATVRTGHETTDWLQTGKEVCEGCILSFCFFSLYAEYIHHEKCWAG